MKEQYKIIIVAENNNSMHIKELQDCFNQGWQYVDKIIRPVSSLVNSNFNHQGDIAIIIKK